MRLLMNSKDWKKIRHRIEYVSVRLLLLLVWSASLSAALRGAEIFGWFVFWIVRVRRKVVMDNLKHAFPEKSIEERLLIARRSYQGFAKMVVDFMRYPIMDHETVLSLCELKNKDKEKLDWLIKNGKGSVMVAGHFGSWELMCAYLAAMGYPISSLVAKQHNKFVDQMMNDFRQSMGITIIHRGMAVRGLIKTLRNNGFIGLLADQDAHRTGVFVDFLGRKSSTHQGPAIFALKTRAPILFGTAIRLPKGRMRIEVDLLRFDHLKDLTPGNIQEVTQAHATILESYIRRYPDHWFWMHRRWKTKPPRS